MKNMISRFVIGSMIFSGALFSVQASDNAAAVKKADTGFNQKATNLFVSLAKNGTLTPEKLNKLKAKKADINAMYKDVNGKQKNLFLESVCFPDPRAIRECNDGSFNYTQEYMNRQNILVALVNAGADTNVTDSDGKNALVLAILCIGNDKYRDGIVKYLHRNAHVAIEKADSLGGTPLMYAVIKTANISQSENGNVPPLVSYLVDAKANVNAADAGGTTVLMYAAKLNTLETVKYLVKHGAKIDAKDKNGKTAADYAQNRDQKKIAKYLEEAMLDNL